MRLSKRLEVCMKYADGYKNLADIGTDHAHVPIAAIKRGYVHKAQAIDDKYGPFVIAYGNVKKYELSDRITVKRADGFEKIDDDTDVAIVAGLGGFTISKMIEYQDLKSIKRLILQPNDHPEDVRLSLNQKGYKITDELVFEDKNKTYDVIVADFGTEVLSPLEIKYGPINLKYQLPAFVERLTKKIAYIEKVVKELDNPDEHAHLIEDVNSMKEALSWNKK